MPLPPPKEKPLVLRPRYARPGKMAPPSSVPSEAVSSVRANLQKRRSLRVVESQKRKVVFESKIESSVDEVCVTSKSMLERFQEWQLKAVPRVLSSDETILELHHLVNKPIPEGESLLCHIEIISHIDNSRPFFVLTMKSSNDDADNGNEKRIAIMTAKKAGLSLRYHYLITLEPEDYMKKDKHRSKWYFGKLVCAQPSKSGTCSQYLVYDRGISKKKYDTYKKMKHQYKSARTSKMPFIPFLKTKIRERKEADKQSARGSTSSWRSNQDSEISSYSYSGYSSYESYSDPTSSSEDSKSAKKDTWRRKKRQLILSVIYPTSLKSKSAATQISCGMIKSKNPASKLSPRTLKQTQNNLIQKHVSVFDSCLSKIESKGKLDMKQVNKISDDYLILFNEFDSAKSKRPRISELVKYPVAPSIKNYELGPPNSNDQYPVTGLARIGAKRYFLTVRQPMNLYQAFAIAVSKIDSCGTLKQKIRRNIFT